MVASTSAMMVWKSKKWMDPLGLLLFPSQNTHSNKTMCLRSHLSDNAKIPVPGYSNLAANLLARTWNSATELQNAQSVGAAKIAARKWAKTLQF